LNQRAILAKLNSQLDEEEYNVLRQSISEETARIEEQRLYEKCDGQDLILQAML
jgi:RNA binding exosome subunit